MIATRCEVLSPDEPGGLPVAVRSEAFLVHKTSERVIGLMDSEADVSRLRLRVEGSRRFEAGGGTLTPYPISIKVAMHGMAATCGHRCGLSKRTAFRARSHDASSSPRLV